MPEEEEAEAHIKEIAKKTTEEKTMQSIPDVCESPPSPSEPVPIPYPNTATSKDTSSGSKNVKVDGKEVVTKKSSFKKSTGDEAGQSNAKGLNKVLNAMKVTKILNIPLWVWSLGVIILIIAIWLLVTNSIQPSEPIEHFLD